MALRFPPGTVCSLFYDAGDSVVEVGHYIVTNGGSGYLLTQVRKMKSIHPGRLALRCIRCEPDCIPAGAVVHQLNWYRREKRKAKT